MRDFRELLVWQKAHALTLKLYPRGCSSLEMNCTA
jgi:hypothetical protein